MPPTPEQPSRLEIQPFPFFLSSRFESRETSQAPYDTIQAIVRQDLSDFSVFRLIENWPESLAKAPPSSKKWYVAVIGNPPPESLKKQVTDAIQQGEVVPLPDAVVSLLVTKRREETAKRPYTEIHRTFTMSRRTENTEKQKRKQQDKSRRRNRGK